MEKTVDPEARFFIEQLQKAAPGAPADQVHRCYHLFVGSLVYFIMERARISRLSGADVASVQKTLAFLSSMISDRLNAYQAPY